LKKSCGDIEGVAMPFTEKICVLTQAVDKIALYDVDFLMQLVDTSQETA
jgi:hypothetical protein